MQLILRLHFTLRVHREDVLNDFNILCDLGQSKPLLWEYRAFDQVQAKKGLPADGREPPNQIPRPWLPADRIKGFMKNSFNERWFCRHLIHPQKPLSLHAYSGSWVSESTTTVPIELTLLFIEWGHLENHHFQMQGQSHICVCLVAVHIPYAIWLDDLPEQLPGLNFELFM